MINILLIENDPGTMDILQHALSTEFGAVVFVEESAAEAIKFLKDHSIRLIISRDKLEHGDQIENTGHKILSYLYEMSEKPPPIIVMGEVEFSGIEFETISTNFKVDKITTLIKKVMGLSKEDMEQLKMPDYISIPLGHFYLMNVSPVDVYIKIGKKGPKQFVKRILKGDEFDKSVIERYEKDGLVEFFVPKEDRILFMDNLMEQSIAKLKSGDLKEEESVEIISDAYEINQELLKDMKVSEHAVKMCRASMESMVATVQNNKKMATLLRAILNNKGSYAYRHSHLICLFGYEVIPKLQWGSLEQYQQNYEKLVFVAFFHDILLAEDRLIEIESKRQLYDADLSEEEKQLVSNHANLASTIVQQYPKSPNGADVIIRQHHGQSNGVGFAESYKIGLSAMSILFIVLEYFAGRIIKFESPKDSVPGIFQEMEEKFPLSTYRKAINALKETLISEVKENPEK